MKHFAHVAVVLALWLSLSSCRSTDELKFLAIGCGPYRSTEQIWLEECVALANNRGQGEFLVHLGDLVTGGESAPPSYYAGIARTLGRARMPTFVVPGDNEWNDQANPDRAWQVWRRFFMHHHRHWDHAGSLKKMYPKSDGIQHHTGRPENFAFVRKGVLIIGINLTGGRVHDADEWDRRLLDDARWVRQNYHRYADHVRAAVILAHAPPKDPFTAPFRAASRAFDKPVLYLHADGHTWHVDRPWPEKNILKVQTDQLGIAPPLLVTVKEGRTELFQFDRQFMRGPYLALGTPHAMRIVWRTRRDIDPVVRYGRAPNRLEHSTSRHDIMAKTKDHADSSLALHSSADGVRQYEATISGLEPSTTYFYAVYDGDQLLAGGDQTYRFTTHPEPGATKPLRFWVVGDSGTGNQNQADVHLAMRSLMGSRHHPLDIYLHVGDMAYDSGTDHEFERRFFKPYRQTLRNTVCWPAMGNHEGKTSSGETGIGPYYDAYVLPTHGEAGGLASGTEAYYSFDYGSAHFIALNSHDLDRSPGAAMAQWLRADLAQTHADWIFAYWHHPPYTKGSHDSDTEQQLVEMRENIMPILEDGGVDIVFTGHSHIYERSMLIDGAYATPTTAEGVVLDDGDGDPRGDGAYRKSDGLHPHEGTIVIVTGHGGTGLGRTGLGVPSLMGTMPIMRRVIYPEHGSVMVDVNGDTATAIMLNSKGEQRDLFRIVKRGRVTPNRVADPFQLTGYTGMRKWRDRIERNIVTQDGGATKFALRFRTIDIKGLTNQGKTHYGLQAKGFIMPLVGIEPDDIQFIQIMSREVKVDGQRLESVRSIIDGQRSREGPTYRLTEKTTMPWNGEEHTEIMFKDFPNVPDPWVSENVRGKQLDVSWTFRTWLVTGSGQSVKYHGFYHWTSRVTLNVGDSKTTTEIVNTDAGTTCRWVNADGRGQTVEEKELRAALTSGNYLTKQDGTLTTK